MINKLKYPVLIISFLAVITGCNSNKKGGQTQTESLTVIPVVKKDVTIYIDYNATIEGISNIEIRPQVDGVITRLYVDEGAYVRKGDPIFQIDESPFRQELNRANANLITAKAQFEKATIENDRINRLAQSSVVSDVQQKTAQTEYDAALGGMKQAEAAVSAASINLGYTTIIAPADGVLGNFPYKTGSLISKNDPVPLTKLTSNNTMYVYFSMSEKDFARFNDTYKGNTIEEKITQVPPVRLLLSDNSHYSQPGKLDIVAGQFNQETGMIVFRALFTNTDNTLKSGTTGKIRLSFVEEGHIVIPQKATFELQDRVFVFALNNENKVERKAVSIKRSVPNYYILNSGLNEGDNIVFTGIGRLRDGMEIAPQYQPFDSLLVNQPLPNL